jgi:hypothetical protein
MSKKTKKTINKSHLPIAAGLFGSSIIWGAVIVGCSLKLKGTDCYADIQTALFLGVFFHWIFIWGPLAAMLKREKEKQSKSSE